jgi:23S rRNA (uracil1939-C5)-methyltransferase
MNQKTITLNMDSMANGGAAIGRDAAGRPIFVPFTIPGERVRATITDDKERYAHARLQEVVTAAPGRVTPRCPHFGACGGCHFQHMEYETQLQVKENVVRDQLQRIGNLEDPAVRPSLPNPTPWAYGNQLTLSPTPDDGLGLWSPPLDEVMPINECHIVDPALVELMKEFVGTPPGLRRMTLWIGDDGALLVALEVEDVEPPSLEVDFPVSVAMILPDETAVSLIGDLFTVQALHGRDFRVSAGCFFQPSLAAAELLVDEVVNAAALTPEDSVLEMYCGVGAFTAFLAEKAGRVAAVEANPDAIADAAVNLADVDNVFIYQGRVEEVLPQIEGQPDVAVVNPPEDGLSVEALDALLDFYPERIVYVGGDLATAARDGKRLHREGYHLDYAQPVDTHPQTYRLDTVLVWQKTTD